MRSSQEYACPTMVGSDHDIVPDNKKPPSNVDTVVESLNKDAVNRTDRTRIRRSLDQSDGRMDKKETSDKVWGNIAGTKGNK